MKSKEEQRKEEFFGTVMLRPAPGDFQLSQIELRRPLEGPRSVARLFCEGCGLLREITDEWIPAAEKEFNVNGPQDMSKYYVHVQRCIACDEMYKDIEFRRIDSVD